MRRFIVFISILLADCLASGQAATVSSINDTAGIKKYYFINRDERMALSRLRDIKDSLNMLTMRVRMDSVNQATRAKMFTDSGSFATLLSGFQPAGNYTQTLSLDGTALSLNNGGGSVVLPTSIGPKGDKGDLGNTGADGLQGLKGDKGNTGDTGPQGIQGATGLVGIQGIKGDQGIQGVIGNTGSQGLKGDTGNTGATGLKGDTGQTGAKGDQGVQGIQGIAGTAGTQGIKGDVGLTGSKGDQGLQGIQGLTGSQGIIGLTGAQGQTGTTGSAGSQGIQGIQGLTGTTGATGSNATITLSTNGYVGIATLAAGALNIPNYTPYYDSVTTTGTTGNAVFYLTSNRLSTGAALYTAVSVILPIVNDPSTNYTYGWTISADKKTLTINVKSSAATLIAALGLTLLGVPTNVASGTKVFLLVRGN